VETEITRKKGIDTLVSGYSPGKVEEENEIKVADSVDYGGLFKKYKRFKEIVDFPRRPEERWVDEVLSPDEINLFLQTYFIHEDNRNVTAMGLFTSRLLQNSYLGGYNNFKISMKNIPPIDSLGTCLWGCEENPLVMTIDGNVGGSFGFKAFNCRLTVNGDVDFLSHGMENSIITIHGEYEKDDLDVAPIIGIRLGFTQISGNCTFKSSQYSTAKKLADLAYCKREANNKVFFIHPDGREELMENIYM